MASPLRPQLGQQLQLPEDRRHGALVLAGVPCLPDGLGVPLAVPEQVDEVEPDLLHPQHGVAAAVKGLGIRLVEGVVEGAQGRALQRLAALEHRDEGGTGHQAPADHYGLQPGEGVGQSREVPRTDQIPVIADRIAALCQDGGQILPSDGVAVHILLHPEMDGELVHRIAVVAIQNGPELLRVPDAQPGLDGDGAGGGVKDRVQEPLQFLWQPQKAGALALGHHRAGGAAQIQVDLRVTHGRQLPRRPQEVLRPPHQQLGHGGQPPIVLGQNLPQLPFGEAVILGGGDEGDKIAVHAAEPAAMGLPVQGSGESLHRGECNLHGSCPLLTRRAAGGGAACRPASQCCLSGKIVAYFALFCQGCGVLPPISPKCKNLG